LKKYILFFVLTMPFAANGASLGLTNGSSKFFYGGGLGASFGDVDTVTLSPLAGINLNDKTSVGLQFSYVYRKDSRGQRDVTTNDYATTLFARYHLTSQFFLEADAEHLNNEFVRTDASTDRRTFNSFLAGGGIRTPIGGNASVFVSVLYNFSYDKENSPYSDPISISGGIGVGF